MLVTKQIEIDMGHRVPSHKGKCRNCHGHRYRIEVGVNDKVITKKGSSSEGMVIDFSDLKEIMMSRLDVIFDHSFTIFRLDKYAKVFLELANDGQKINFVPFIPTAENLAKYWYEILKKDLQSKGIRLLYVRVWETPTSTATYQK